MKRPLTPEEKELWERVTQGDKPLHATQRKEPHHTERNKAVAKRLLIDPVSRIPFIQNNQSTKLNSYAGIDRNTAERFRKGQYPIDATLDLHGLSRDKAQAALFHFVAMHYGQGSRCLLVITGKGLILRESLPHWLCESELRSVILAFDVAKQKHGGSGAYYILLKRKRGRE